MPKGIPTTEAKAEIETCPVNREPKTSKCSIQFKAVKLFHTSH